MHVNWSAFRLYPSSSSTFSLLLLSGDLLGCFSATGATSGAKIVTGFSNTSAVDPAGCAADSEEGVTAAVTVVTPFARVVAAPAGAPLGWSVTVSFTWPVTLITLLEDAVVWRVKSNVVNGLSDLWTTFNYYYRSPRLQ